MQQFDVLDKVYYTDRNGAQHRTYVVKGTDKNDMTGIKLNDEEIFVNVSFLKPNEDKED